MFWKIVAGALLITSILGIGAAFHRDSVLAGKSAQIEKLNKQLSLANDQLILDELKMSIIEFCWRNGRPPTGFLDEDFAWVYLNGHLDDLSLMPMESDYVLVLNPSLDFQHNFGAIGMDISSSDNNIATIWLKVWGYPILSGGEPRRIQMGRIEF